MCYGSASQCQKKNSYPFTKQLKRLTRLDLKKYRRIF